MREEAVGTRADRKQRTRRAILDAALELTAGSSLVALSLRQVTKQVGIVPTAFYRHFDSVEDLGLALVDESFAPLRAVLREVRRGIAEAGSRAGAADRALDLLVDRVGHHRAHVAFVARERVAGPPAVREAIRDRLERCEAELAAGLADRSDTSALSPRDLLALARLLVTVMVATAEELVTADATGRPEHDVVTTARAQLRMALAATGV